MPVYFVSGSSGNDGNTGLTAALAWATIGKAVTEVAAGDTVYIGPGTYREKITLATAGGLGTEITWIPDPEAQFLTGDNPGIVRVTGCGVDELPTIGTVWASVDRNHLGDANKKYNQVFIDGAGTPVQAASGQVCFFYGVTGIGTGICFNSTASVFVYCIGHSSGTSNCFTGGTANHCIALTTFYGFTNVTATHCVAFAAMRGFSAGTAYNCIAFAPDAFRDANVYNSIAIGATRGFRGSTHVCKNNKAILCATGFFGESLANIYDPVDCSAVYCIAVSRGGGYETRVPAAAKSLIYDLSPIIEALKPLLQFAYNDGDNTVSVGDYDILGLARRLGDGTIDIGPYAFSDMDTNFTEGSPAIEITGAGMVKFVFHAEGGTLFSKTVEAKWASYVGANKPQIIVDGDHVTRATGTAVGTGVAYETVTVTATPAADGEVELFLYARDTDAAAKTYFKDIT